MLYSRAMGADCTAAWLGALLITALSFVPATMAPNRKARWMSGLLARLSLPFSAGAALWSTLSMLRLTPPPGGVIVCVSYPFLLAPVGLAAWGLGLIASRAIERASGRRVPALPALVLALGSVVLMLAAK